MVRRFAFLIPIVGLIVCAGVWAICKANQEPLAQRKNDIAQYVRRHDGIDPVVLGHTEYANGGTAWSVRLNGNTSFSFTVVDDGFFRTHVASDDDKISLTRP